MKRITITLLLLLFATGIFAQAVSYSEAKFMMQKNSKKLKAFEQQRKVSEISRKGTLHYRLPKFIVTGQWIHLNDDMGLDFNDKRNMAAKLLHLPKPQILGNWSIVLQEQNFGSVDLNLAYPIYTGGLINAGVKATKLKADIKDKEVDAKENALLTELASRYFQLQLATKAVAVRKEALEVTQQHYFNAEKLAENGMIAEVEKLQAQAALADAEREFKAAQKDKILARTALAGTLGIPDFSKELNSNLFLSTQLQSIAYYKAEAVKNYPDLTKLYLTEQLTEQNIKAKRSEYFPKVAILGQKHLLTKDFPLEKKYDWFVGVGVSFNLFDGLKRRHDLHKAKVMHQSVKFYKEQAVQDIQILVQKHYQELQKQQEMVASLNKDLKFAEELLNARQKAFKQGLTNSTEVIDAALYRSAIQLKKLKAMYDYDICLASLLETCGQSNQLEMYMK